MDKKKKTLRDDEMTCLALLIRIAAESNPVNFDKVFSTYHLVLTQSPSNKQAQRKWVIRQAEAQGTQRH